MNTDFKDLLPLDFQEESRVWIYQANRKFSDTEVQTAEDMLKTFIGEWKSHGAQVKGFAGLFFGRFIVILADETATAVGGCSTDSSVHLVQELEKKFNVQLLDRQNLAFLINEKIQLLPLTQIEHAIENIYIGADTAYFNNTVLTKKEMTENWIIPAGKSWLAKNFRFPQTTA